MCDIGEIEILADHIIKLNDKQRTNDERMYRGKGVRISLCNQHITQYISQLEEDNKHLLETIKQILKER